MIVYMKIFVKAKPGAKTEKVEQIDSSHFSIFVKEPAKNNRANFRIVELIADFFSVSPSSVRLLQGRTLKEKIFEIE